MKIISNKVQCGSQSSDRMGTNTGKMEQYPKLWQCCNVAEILLKMTVADNQHSIYNIGNSG